MSKLLNVSASIALSVFMAGCATDLEDDPTIEDLEKNLSSLSKADSADSGVTVYSNGIGLRNAAARSLYNLLDESDARSRVGAGNRLLFTSGIACITNGTATYCELRGRTKPGNASYEVVMQGNYSGAASLYNLLAKEGNDTFVSAPWFACAQEKAGFWCGIEASKDVTISFDSLEDSGPNYVYEGWAISGGVPTTTGRFRGGDVVQQIPLSIADDILYVLTLEPTRGDKASPSSTHLLAGKLESGRTTDLGTEHPAALGTDFSDAKGAYILATPSTTRGDDDNQGIWFVNPVLGQSSLELPELPAGWAYEGWIVTPNGPVSTGRFTDIATADDDGAGISAGREMSPPFPGQDFINPAINLLGTTVVISVEPQPDNSAKPFAIKPLIDPVVEEIVKPQLQSLGNTSEKRPSAVASF